MTTFREDIAREIKLAIERSRGVIVGDVYDTGDPLGLSQGGYFDAADRAFGMVRAAAFEEAAKKIESLNPEDPIYQAVAMIIRKLKNDPPDA
jgi:hypothetical protein